MFFKKKPRDISKNPFYDSGNTIIVHFECNKCGEKFRSHLRKYYDVSVNYGKGKGAYRLDKEFVGSKCQNKIQIIADFSRAFRPLSFEIIGGRFLSEEEYGE
ncbi:MULTISPECIES: hypothetical protein [unclassified Mesotoga]|jgi:hypothetical protein|uniref:hypothetical protein n=1 Tax=unclassified Mesotoga TaxID=1184398 RepID=UPI0025CEDA5F|nr:MULTISPECIES: hypothetical protein [unclassified Mesotoga]